MANSTGSLPPIGGARLNTNAWQYATPSYTTTTDSAAGNTGAGSLIKAGMLARFGKQAMDNYLAAKAAEELGGKIGLPAGYQAVGDGGSGLFGAGTNAAAGLGGELGGQIGIAGNKALADSITAGLWAPPGEAAQAVGGLATAPLDGGINLASNMGGQAAGEAASGIYGNLAGQAAEAAAEQAGTGLLSQAGGAVPVVGTALNVGANLAQGNYGAAGGAAAGAALGSVIPGVGTALGGTIGGLLGSFIR